MHAFIENAEIVTRDFERPLDYNFFNKIYSGKDKILSKEIRGRVLLNKPTTSQIQYLIDAVYYKKTPKLELLMFAALDRKKVNNAIKSMFQIIEAGGGIVRKEESILMIFRNGHWDLPKGKIEKNETEKEGSLREVEEECMINAKLEEKLCHTWHSYRRNGKNYLKKTYWFRMSCLDDSKMTPQIEEGITDLKWFTENEAKEKSEISYKSIKNVISRYYNIKPEYEPQSS